MSQGQVEANRYPFAKVWAEAEIARRRAKDQEAFRMGNDKIVHGAIHGGKKGHSLFNQTVKGYSDGGST